MDFTREFGMRIKMLLLTKNISQKEFSKMTGLTEASISNYIHGKRVCNASTLEKIAKALDVSTDYLLGREKKE